MEGKEGLRFIGYPPALQAPNIVTQHKEDANPVLRGQTLIIGSWLVSKLGLAQYFLWANAGFNGLRGLTCLKDYHIRFDPTVIPLPTDDALCSSKLDLNSFPRQHEALLGRYHSIADYRSLYLSGDLTPMEVAEYLIPLIRRDIETPSHHSIAFIDSVTERILSAARESTARYKAGSSIGLLDGIFTAVKNETDVEGYRTTHGRVRNDRAQPVAKKAAKPVQLLEQAGAIILGSLNMHELGCDTTGNNLTWGTPRNPHNDRYYTGGSSSGCAYVVASGLVPISIGADGGGSIRIPASFCGIYGLKPSHNQLYENGSTVTVLGPLAATMSDLEIAYRAMGAPDPQGPTMTPSRRYIGLINGMWDSDKQDPGVQSLCNEAVQWFQEQGYECMPVDIPLQQEGQKAHAVTILSEMVNGAKANSENPTNWLNDLSPANKILLAVGSQTPTEDYLLAQQLRNLLMQHLAFYFKKYPSIIMVSPTTPMAGWPIGAEIDLKYGASDANTSVRNMECVWLANFCGTPAISCPVGYVDPKQGEGMIPVGIMGMGDWGSEDGLLEWGRKCEEYLNTTGEKKIVGGGRVRPSNWEDVISSASKDKEDL